MSDTSKLCDQIIRWQDMEVNVGYRDLLHRNGLDTFDQVINHVGGTVLKQGRWGDVRLLTLPTINMVMKRKLRSGRWVCDFLRHRAKASPFIEWKNLWTCRAAGIPAPEPIAAGKRGVPWLHQSFVLMSALNGECVISKIASLRSHAVQRWALLRNTGALVRRLHDHCLYHNDLYLDHVWVTDNVDQGGLALLDLNRMVRTRQPSARLREKDLAKLLLSARLDAGLSRSDTLRIFDGYRRNGSKRAKGHVLLSRVIHRARKIYARTPRFRSHKSTRRG